MRLSLKLCLVSSDVYKRMLYASMYPSVAGLVTFGHICGLVAICVWIAQELRNNTPKIKKETYNLRH